MEFLSIFAAKINSVKSVVKINSLFVEFVVKRYMDFGPQQIGKWLIWVGIIIALVGSLMIVLGRVGLFKLPGDLEFGSKNWRIYFPIASCILISIVLTLILWLIHYFRR